MTELTEARTTGSIGGKPQSHSRMYMRDDVERYGLMLSGGLDSRGLLSLGRSRYSTFTTAPSQNNEFKIARELARNFGAEHKFLLRNPDHLVENFSSMVLASNAMTVFPMPIHGTCRNDCQ